jgi:DHA1 family multidrug resistance protein-like MFS transporter
MSRDNKFLLLALFLWGAGEGLFIYIQPVYLQTLGADPLAIGTALSLAGVAAAASHIPAGWLADHMGRRGVMIAGWGLGALACLLMYLTTNLWLFVAASVAYAFTLFVVGPLSAYAAEARGQQTAQRAMTQAYGGFWAGTIFSPALGGWVAETFGARMVFGLAAGVIFLATIIVLFLRPQAVTPPHAGQTRYGSLFRNRAYLQMLALTFVCIVALYLGLPLMPNFVQEVRGYDLQMIGWLGTINSVGGMLANVLLGQSEPRRGFWLGQILVGVGMILILSSGHFLAVGVAYLFRSGWNLAHSMSIAQVNRLVASTETGLAFGVMETAISAGQILAPLLAGQLYTFNPALPFQVCLVLVACTFVLAWRVLHSAPQPALQKT